jgi:NDP-sugar pyrophosphorylase family protein
MSPLPVAILSGGRATRLRPATEKVPKALLPVAGRPFLAHQLDLLRKRGIERVVICAGYLGEMIRERFPDLEYSFDGPALLGTGGAVRKALPLLGDTFFVLYGDSYLPADYGAVAEAFARAGRPALMTVFRNEGRWDTSNVEFRDGEIVVYDKRAPTPAMLHIDYGLSVLTPRAFDGLATKTPLDLAEVLQKLVAAGDLAGYEVRERFYEIGSMAGLAELEALLV